MQRVWRLLSGTEIYHYLVSNGLIHAIFFVCTAPAQRMWSLKMLHKLLVPQKNSNTSGAPLLNFLKNKAPADSALSKLLDELPAAILKQYEYEEPCVRGGTHLMHSDFFKVSIVL